MKNRLTKTLRQVGLRTVITVASVVALVWLLLWRLTSLLPGWSPAELTTRANSLHLHTILHNPINAPYNVVTYGLLKLLPHNILAVRLTSVIFAAIAISLFFFIVRSWHTTRIAWLASLLFGTSTWFLRAARLGTPDVLLFFLLILMALGLWLQRSHHRGIVYVLYGIAAALGLYVPGIIWFLVITAFWQRKVIVSTIKRLPIWLMGLGILGFLVFLAPLVYGLVHNWHLVWAVAGLPSHVPKLGQTLHHLFDVPLNIFIRGPYQPGLWVGRTPVIDVFESILFIFGVYSYWQHHRLARFWSLLSIFVITSILVALGGPVSLSLLLPFVYLVMATGMAFLLGEWLSVFPRNPIARGFGVFVVLAAVLLSCAYQLNRYFVAWPHQTVTKQLFSHQEPPSSQA